MWRKGHQPRPPVQLDQVGQSGGVAVVHHEDHGGGAALGTETKTQGQVGQMGGYNYPEVPCELRTHASRTAVFFTHKGTPSTPP